MRRRAARLILLATLCALGGLLYVGLSATRARRGDADVPGPTKPVASLPLAVPSAVRVRQGRTGLESSLIRVNLTPSAVAELQISVDGPYQVRSIGRSDDLGRSPGLSPTIATARADGIQIGKAIFRHQQLELTPDASPAIWVENHQYRGNVRLYRQENNTLTAVNVLPLSDYLASVVDSEMPASFPDAARQAQAVVSRTYALYQMERRHPLFDVFASTRSQKYLGFQYRGENGRRLAGETSLGRQVVEQTADLVCHYQGKLFCTYYAAVCGGRTTPGKDVFADAAAPLKSVPCEWCRESPHFRWTISSPKPAASQALKRYFVSKGKSFQGLQRLAASGKAWDAYAEHLEVQDGRSRFRMSPDTLRSLLTDVSLPSPRFVAEVESDRVIFHGCGHGHGVGLCQWGARGQALEGKSFQEIIAYYYSGAELAGTRR